MKIKLNFEKNKNDDQLLIVTTGGTIDSSPEYDPAKKSVFDGSYIEQTIQQIKPHFLFSVLPIFQKDSNDITYEDRSKLAQEIVNQPEQKILVTHDTDTMVETAKFLAENSVPGKIIILTGSFVPISQPGSDAHLNLGFALGSFVHAKQGVYIAMNGTLFDHHNVRKNFDDKLFERER